RAGTGGHSRLALRRILVELDRGSSPPGGHGPGTGRLGQLAGTAGPAPIPRSRPAGSRSGAGRVAVGGRGPEGAAPPPRQTGRAPGKGKGAGRGAVGPARTNTPPVGRATRPSARPEDRGPAQAAGPARGPARREPWRAKPRGAARKPCGAEGVAMITLGGAKG